MKSMVLCFFLLFSASILFAEEPNEPFAILNLLAYGGIGELRYQFGGKPGGEVPNLDDSSWERVYAGFKWNKSHTNVWFRATIVIPSHLGGFSLAGRSAKLFLHVDNAFDVFVNGKMLARNIAWKGNLQVIKSLQPGARYVIAIRGINHRGPGKLLEARLEFSGMEEFRAKLRRPVRLLIRALKAARQNPGRREKWQKMINCIAARIVKSKAYRKGDQEAFLRVAQDETAELQQIFSKWICFHQAIFDKSGKLLPWTSWRDALSREMAWYLNCPFEKGYPRFVMMTFMDGNYELEREDFIPAMQNSMGILSYLKYYYFIEKKEARLLEFACRMGDYLVNECSTPDTGRYPRFTRSTGYALQTPQAPDCGSQGDRPFEIEPDKGSMAGYALLRLWEETGKSRYFRQALHNAQVLVANMQEGNSQRSTWPFRADYRSGKERGRVSGNMSYILRLFDKLLEHGYSEFRVPRQRLWNWILRYQIPSAKDNGSLWVQFFEDHKEENNRTAWAPLALARYLLEEKESLDPEWKTHARILIAFVNRNLTSFVLGVRVCGEQDHDKRPWGGVLSNYGGVLALYAAATGSKEYKSLAYQILNFCLYNISESGCPSDSYWQEKCGGWQEDAHTDVIHNFMDAIAAFPEWGK